MKLSVDALLGSRAASSAEAAAVAPAAEGSGSGWKWAVGIGLTAAAVTGLVIWHQRQSRERSQLIAEYHALSEETARGERALSEGHSTADLFGPSRSTSWEAEP